MDLTNISSTIDNQIQNNSSNDENLIKTYNKLFQKETGASNTVSGNSNTKIKLTTMSLNPFYSLKTNLSNINSNTILKSGAYIQFLKEFLDFVLENRNSSISDIKIKDKHKLQKELKEAKRNYSVFPFIVDFADENSNTIILKNEYYSELQTPVETVENDLKVKVLSSQFNRLIKL